MKSPKKSPLLNISIDPEIYILKNFLNSQQCNNLIKISTPLLERAMVEGESGIRLSKGRTNQTSFIDSTNSNEVIFLKKYLSENYGIEENNITKIQVLKYKKNEKYVPHFDGYESNLLNSKSGKQRYLTFLIYLSDGFKGGETIFPLLDIKIKPSVGDLIIFRNCFF